MRKLGVDARESVSRGALAPPMLLVVTTVAKLDSLDTMTLLTLLPLLLLLLRVLAMGLEPTAAADATDAAAVPRRGGNAAMLDIDTEE